MKYNQVIILNTNLGMLKNEGLTVDSLKNMLKVKKAIKEYIEKIQEVQLAIMDKFGVKEGNGGYDFKGHEKEKEISDDIKKSTEEEFELPVKKFFTLQELTVSAKSLDTNVLANIEELINYE